MADLMESLDDWQAGKSLSECNRFMLANEISCDVTFLCGQRREPVKAHRYVLFSRSSVFQSIFSSSLIEADGAFPVSDIDAETFKLLLIYLYTDDVTIELERVDSILYAAKKYAVKGLVQKCLAYLESCMSVENVCTVLEQIHLYDGRNMEDKCLKYIFENGSDVLKSESFGDLSAAHVEQIVKSDELVVDEMDVFNAMMNWSEKECRRKGVSVTDTNRREVLGPFLYHIRFPLMNTMFFTNHVSTRQILNAQEVIAIFQYYHGRDQASNWHFNINKRRGFSLYSVIRYNFIGMNEMDSGTGHHVISVSCSKSILLHGVIVYGCQEGSAEYSVTIEITDEESRKCLSKEHITVKTDKSHHTSDAMLSKTVLLQSGKKYTIVAEINGPPTKIGLDGRRTVVVEGVTFTFISRSNSNTTVEKGQLPGILFTFPKVNNLNKFSDKKS
ncbi:hypothetical protein ACJMK2_013837 [Sinanodonta woodiana]|uniref:BTB domain-containing protein n=1 Tax=Sinanodonta woodiana TaxID=1069815 RepID=A0ABD3V177_SINWO